MTFGAGFKISIMRLWMRISNCSRESLSMNAARLTVYFLMSMGSGTGTDDFGVVPRRDVDYLFDRLVEDSVLIGADLDAEAVYGVGFLGAGPAYGGGGRGQAQRKSRQQLLLS